MREAISLMQLVLQNNRDSSRSHVSVNSFGVSEMIDRASKYLASTQSSGLSPPTATHVHVKVASHDGVGVHFPDAESSMITGPFRLCPLQTSFAVPIRLDHLSCDYQDERDPELEAALMLYNFGVAHFCESREQAANSPTKESRALAKASVRLFKAALETMDKYVEPAESDIFPEDEAMIECIVLSHMVQAQLDLGKLADAHSCYQEIRTIQDMQGETLMDMCSMDSETAAAAA